MNTRHMLARLAGVATLGASWGVCLWLRALMADAPNEPTLLQAGLVLASFVLTALGLVLILKGGRILPGPMPAQKAQRAHRRSGMARPDTLAALSLIDERAGRADGLTRRALRARRENKKRG